MMFHNCAEWAKRSKHFPARVLLQREWTPQKYKDSPIICIVDDLNIDQRFPAA
jgi:hypothetical protein